MTAIGSTRFAALAPNLGRWTSRAASSCKALGTGCRFGITEEIVVDGGIEGPAQLGPQHEGGPDVAHGGVVAGILDEVLGHAAMSRGLLVVTRQLTIEYIKPTPLRAPLSLSSRVDVVDGRKWAITGTFRCLRLARLLPAAPAYGSLFPTPTTNAIAAQCWRRIRQIRCRARFSSRRWRCQVKESVWLPCRVGPCGLATE